MVIIEYNSYYVITIMNLALTVPKWINYLYYTNQSHEVSLSFVWLKFSSFGWDIDMRRIKSGKTLSLGMPKAPQGNIQGRIKRLSLGMPRKASPLSSSKLLVYLTRSYISICHMICVLLGAYFQFYLLFE